MRTVYELRITPYGAIELILVDGWAVAPPPKKNGAREMSGGVVSKQPTRNN